MSRAKKPAPKPLHEQTLTVFDGGGQDCQQAILAEDGRMLAMTRAEDGREIAEFFAAAPYMARELRHLVRLLESLEKDGSLDVPGLATLNGARAALRKGGVIP